MTSDASPEGWNAADGLGWALAGDLVSADSETFDGFEAGLVVVGLTRCRNRAPRSSTTWAT